MLIWGLGRVAAGLENRVGDGSILRWFELVSVHISPEILALRLWEC